jgi:integrase
LASAGSLICCSLIVTAIRFPQGATKGIVDVKFHALRHTHASELIEEGESVVRVSRRLGHHSPAFTLRVYAQLVDREEAEAEGRAEAL